MAKIKKIKKELYKELENEFDLLSDAEVQESGITLEEGEVLVVAKPAPVQPVAGTGDEKDRTIAELRGRLHEVNQESASRRIALKEAEQKITDLTGQVTKLTDQVGESKTTTAKAAAADLFAEYVKEKGITFVSDEAAADVKDTVFAAMKWDKKVTKDDIGKEVDAFIEKKKYYVQKVELPRTDGGRQSTAPAGSIEVDLEEVAQAFNLPYLQEGDKPTKGES
jgi:hypothetical protein